MSPRKVRRRSLSVLIAVGVVLTSCSGDSDSDADDTVAGIGRGHDRPPPTLPSTSAPTDTALTGEGLAVGVVAPSQGLLTTLFQGQTRGIDLRRRGHRRRRRRARRPDGCHDDPDAPRRYRRRRRARARSTVERRRSSARPVRPTQPSIAMLSPRQTAFPAAHPHRSPASPPARSRSGCSAPHFPTTSSCRISPTRSSLAVTPTIRAPSWNVAIVARADDYGLRGRQRPGRVTRVPWAQLRASSTTTRAGCSSPALPPRSPTSTRTSPSSCRTRRVHRS